MACQFERCVEARIILRINPEYLGYPVSAGKKRALAELDAARAAKERQMNTGLGIACKGGCLCRSLLQPTHGRQANKQQSKRRRYRRPRSLFGPSPGNVISVRQGIPIRAGVFE